MATLGKSLTKLMSHWSLAWVAAFSLLLQCGYVWAEDSPHSEEQAIAASLATMLQSARTVISKHQNDINDPNRGDKGLTAEAVLKQALINYKNTTGTAPDSYPVESRHGRLIQTQLKAIKQVMDDNQSLINQQGIGFKGFIPATFARLVNESFANYVGDEASVKVTAPAHLVRNRKARPDAWESNVIQTYFQSPTWEPGKAYSQLITDSTSTEFRMMVPEYYKASCLSCHGTPKGSMDITGYPREGAQEKDLGGVISIRLTTKK